MDNKLVATGQLNYKKKMVPRFLHKYFYNRYLLLLLIPGLAYFIIFKYVPMYGILIAFKDFKPIRGIMGSPWIGLENFERLLYTPSFLIILKNTVIISFLKIIFNFSGAVLFALLINEISNSAFKRVVQTISYIPYFLSWVIIATILYTLLSPTIGSVNYFLSYLGIEPIDFLSSKKYFVTVLIVSDLWRNIGYGSIIYLAAIAGIDQQTYEAAIIDGAGRLKRAIHVTLPGMLHMMVVLLVLSVGNIMSAGFDQILNLYNPLVFSVADIIDTYVYRVGLRNFQFSFSTAVSLFKNVVSLILLLLVNWFVRKRSDYSLL